MGPTPGNLTSASLIPFHVERGQGGLAHLFHGNLLDRQAEAIRANILSESGPKKYVINRRRVLQLAAACGGSLMLPAKQSEAQLGAIVGAAIPWFLAGAKWLATTVLNAVVAYTVEQIIEQRLYGDLKSDDPKLKYHSRFSDAVRIEKEVIPGMDIRHCNGYDLRLGYKSEQGFMPYSHNSAEMRSCYLLEYHARNPGASPELSADALEKFDGQFYALHAHPRQTLNFTPEMERRLRHANYRTFEDKGKYVKPEEVEYVANFKNYDGEEYTGFSVKRNGQRMILADIQNVE